MRNRIELFPEGSANIAKVVEGLTRLTVIVPFVHSGGTSRDALINDRCELLKRLREAREELIVVEPNRRDYYIEASGALWRDAQKQHERRAITLDLLILEVDRELEVLLDD